MIPFKPGDKVRYKNPGFAKDEVFTVAFCGKYHDFVKRVNSNIAKNQVVVIYDDENLHTKHPSWDDAEELRLLTKLEKALL